MLWISAGRLGQQAVSVSKQGGPQTASCDEWYAQVDTHVIIF